MNNVNLIGRLTRDPELRYTAKQGIAIARFTVAVDRGLSKDKRAEEEEEGRPTADFIGCICWGKTAENIGRYFSKGSLIAISGRIQTGSYEAQDGTRRYTTDVAVERFYFVENKNIAAGKDQEPDYGMEGDAYPVEDDSIPF